MKLTESVEGFEPGSPERAGPNRDTSSSFLSLAGSSKTKATAFLARFYVDFQGLAVTR